MWQGLKGGKDKSPGLYTYFYSYTCLVLFTFERSYIKRKNLWVQKEWRFSDTCWLQVLKPRTFFDPYIIKAFDTLATWTRLSLGKPVSCSPSSLSLLRVHWPSCCSLRTQGLPAPSGPLCLLFLLPGMLFLLYLTKVSLRCYLHD